MKASRRAALGRGRPPVLVGDKLDALCVLLTKGIVDVTAAAAELRVARATVYNTIKRAETDDDPGGRIAAALAAGRALRREALHGTESCYVHHDCRRPECVAAATEARNARRRTAPAEPEPGPGPVLLPLTPADTSTTRAALYAALTPPLADAS